MWNHDLFTVFNLRNTIENDLLDIHQNLNDPANDFLTAVTNNPNIQEGPYTLQEIMYYTSWIGLDDTIDYKAIFNNPADPASAIQLTRINYVEGVTDALARQTDSDLLITSRRVVRVGTELMSDL